MVQSFLGFEEASQGGVLLAPCLGGKPSMVRRPKVGFDLLQSLPNMPAYLTSKLFHLHTLVLHKSRPYFTIAQTIVIGTGLYPRSTHISPSRLIQ